MTSPVIFNLADGTEVSNDPSFRYKAFLAQEAEREAELERLNALSQDGPGEPAKVDQPAEDEYTNLPGKELKELANQRGVDLTGLTKVGQVRQALRNADALAAAGDEDDDEDEDEAQD